MSFRRITVTDHSPEQAGLQPDKVLEIEIKGQNPLVNAATEAICNEFKSQAKHSVLVEDILETRRFVRCEVN